MAKSSPDALHFLQMEGKLYELEQRTRLHDADDVVDYAQHPHASSSPTTGATTHEEVSDLSSTGDFDTYAPDEE